MRDYIVMPQTSKKQKGLIISSIGARMVRGRVARAYDNLFGTFPPHRSMLRLEHFNSKVFSRDYKKMIRRILLQKDLMYFYKYPEQVEGQFEIDQHNRQNGRILDPWFMTTDQPNPHHIIPTSRGGNDNFKNIRYMDRLPHNDFHTVFQNLTPVEQFIVMTIIHRWALNPEFVHDLKVLHRTIREPECYKDGACNRRQMNGRM